MKKASLFLALFLACISAIAQNNGGERKEKTLSVNVGQGIALGKFASTNVESDASGYAKSGISESLNLSIPISKGKFSIEIGILNGVNKFNSSAYLNSIVSSLSNNNYLMDVAASSYVEHDALIGIAYDLFPEKSKFNMSICPLLGFAQVYSPKITISSYDLISNVYSVGYVSSSSATTIVYGGGINLRYKIFKKVSVLYRSNFIISNPKFKDDVVNLDGTKEQVSFKQPASILYSTIGIGYLF